MRISILEVNSALKFTLLRAVRTKLVELFTSSMDILTFALAGREASDHVRPLYWYNSLHYRLEASHVGRILP